MQPTYSSNSNRAVAKSGKTNPRLCVFAIIFLVVIADGHSFFIESDIYFCCTVSYLLARGSKIVYLSFKFAAGIKIPSCHMVTPEPWPSMLPVIKTSCQYRSNFVSDISFCRSCSCVLGRVRTLKLLRSRFSRWSTKASSVAPSLNQSHKVQK